MCGNGAIARLFGFLRCCPMTTRAKGYPFEVVVAENPLSVVLADQIKSVDWRIRKAQKKGSVSLMHLAEIRGKIQALLV